MNIRRPIFFIGSRNNATPYSEFIPLIRSLRNAGYPSILVCPYNISPKIKSLLRKAQMDYYVGSKYVDYESSNLISDKIASSKINSTGSVKHPVVSFLRILVLNLIYIKHARIIFEASSPSTIVVYGDRSKGIVPAMLRESRKKDIFVIDLEIALSTPEFLYNSYRKGNPDFSVNRLINRILSKILPDQFMSFDGDTVSFYKPSLAILYIIFGMLPSKPWLPGGSWADKLLVTCQYNKQEYSGIGINPNKIHVVGQFSLSELYRYSQDILTSAYASSSSSTKSNYNVVIALPQLYEHGILSFEQAKAEHLWLIKSLLLYENLTISISLHPKMDPDSYFDYTQPNVNILNTPLRESLPKADLFISYFPSTIKWATLLNIKSVFLDFYQLGLGHIVPSNTYVISDKVAFRNKILSIIADSYRPLAKDEQLKLPLFDSLFLERFISHCKIQSDMS